MTRFRKGQSIVIDIAAYEKDHPPIVWQDQDEKVRFGKVPGGFSLSITSKPKGPKHVIKHNWQPNQTATIVKAFRDEYMIDLGGGQLGRYSKDFIRKYWKPA